MSDTKYRESKKKLQVESAMIAIGLGVLAALGYGMDYLSDNYVEQSNTISGEVSSTGVEWNTLREKYSKVQKNSFLYDEVAQKNSDDMLSIDREMIRNKVDDLKIKYLLSDLHLTVPPATDVPDKKAKGKNNVITVTDATLTFNALSDEDAYNFVQELQDELPGVVRIVEFGAKRENSPLEAGLRSIIETGKYAFVSGTLKFKWFGLRAVEPPAAPARPIIPNIGRP